MLYLGVPKRIYAISDTTSTLLFVILTFTAQCRDHLNIYKCCISLFLPSSFCGMSSTCVTKSNFRTLGKPFDLYTIVYRYRLVLDGNRFIVKSLTCYCSVIMIIFAGFHIQIDCIATLKAKINSFEVMCKSKHQWYSDLYTVPEM